jgi:hypothetical protein
LFDRNVQDKYEANASPLGSISVADIQSIQQSNALGFGANTSLSIRAHNRTLEVGDQKELVADSVLFVLQRWISLRASKNNPTMSPEVSIPVVEMPAALQKEVVRHFETLSIHQIADMMQQPPFMYSWTPDARQTIMSEYSALFQKIFASDPSKSAEHLKRYIMLQESWTSEIVIYYNARGKVRRVLLDPAPCIHFLSDHFASIKRMDLTCFDEIHNMDAICQCLKRLRQDYRFVLPELLLPTFLEAPDDVTALITKISEGMDGITFVTSETTAEPLKTSSKILQEDGTYHLQLYSNPTDRNAESFQPYSRAPALSMDSWGSKTNINAILNPDTDALSAPELSLRTMDSGAIRGLSEAIAALQSDITLAKESPTPSFSSAASSSISDLESLGSSSMLLAPPNTIDESRMTSDSTPSIEGQGSSSVQPVDSATT